ncbi:hypothetical protein LXL04_031456 [Taraxacum kok-saghyz]
MKRLFSGHQILAAVYLCCIIATLHVQGATFPVNHHEDNHHGQPSRISVSCNCLRCRLLYKNVPEEIIGTEKRLVPGGPNPLHN